LFDNNHFLPEEWIDRREPVDDLEPDIARADAIRDARKKGIFFLNAFGAQVEASLLRPGATVTDIAVAFYQVAYALGLNLCEGMSMTERAQAWGVERASISKGATQFCNGNGLPPSFYMKKEPAQESFRSARIRSIKQCQTPNFMAA
jgi:hypothetical protein